ncbi:MAG: hypothetical protein JWN50_373 [Parcubacteria group bacterium]|nr:hypothetical protein [Parcubacteria group bacterium]
MGKLLDLLLGRSPAEKHGTSLGARPRRSEHRVLTDSDSLPETPRTEHRQFEEDRTADKDKPWRDLITETDLAARLKVATSFDECMSIANECSSDSEVVNVALEKALSLATTSTECKDALEGWTLEDTLDDAFRNKLVELAQIELDNATSVEVYFEKYDEVRDYFDLEDSDYEVVLGLAATQEECETVYERATDDVDATREMEEKILLKKVDFLDSVEDCAEIWDEHETDSELGKAAICRASDIIRKDKKMSFEDSPSAE